MANKLKPCPFCGSKDVEVSKSLKVVVCNNCGAYGPDGNKRYDCDEESAIDAWNKRS